MPLPILLVACFACALAAGYFYMARQQGSRNPAGRNANNASAADPWHSLLAQLQPLPGPHPGLGLTAVAESYLYPRSNQIELEPDAIYELLGGAAGLRTMQHNAKVMLQLAGYATHWNHVEAVVVTEMIRRDARRLQTALRMVQLEMLLRRTALRAPFRMQEAAAAYHLITARLTTLYQTTHQGLSPQLAAAL